MDIAITVGTVVKKALELLAVNDSGRKFLGYVLCIAVFLLLLPVIVVCGLFGWMANDGELCSAARMASFAKPAVKDKPVRIHGRRRKMKRGEVHISDVLRTFDLLGLIRADTGERGRESDGRVDFPTCPICGHRGCFSFYPQTNSYYCFSDSHPGKCGDAMAYIMERDSLAYPQAKEVLGGLIG